MVFLSSGWIPSGKWMLTVCLYHLLLFKTHYEREPKVDTSAIHGAGGLMQMVQTLCLESLTASVANQAFSLFLH